MKCNLCYPIPKNVLLEPYFAKLFCNESDYFKKIVGFTNSMGTGGSAKGWGFESAMFNYFNDILKENIIKHDATNSDSDFTISTPRGPVDIQAKCYKFEKSDKVQLATLPNNNIFDECLKCITPCSNFESLQFQQTVENHKLPMDLLLTLDYKSKLAKLYLFDFVPLFREIVTCNVNKNGVTLFAVSSKTGRRKAAFEINRSDKKVDSFCLGIWIKKWFLEENVEPIGQIEIPNSENLFKIYSDYVNLKK